MLLRLLAGRMECGSCDHAVTPQQRYPTLPTKSPQQQHLNPSTDKNLQLMVINTPAGTNVISTSCLHPNIWFAMLNICTYHSFGMVSTYNSTLKEIASWHRFLSQLECLQGHFASPFLSYVLKFGGAKFFHGLARKSWMLD